MSDPELTAWVHQMQDSPPTSEVEEGDELPGSIDDPGQSSTPEARVAKLTACAERRIGGVVVVLENIEDLGNRAAIMRSVEALGFLHVHEIGKPCSRAGTSASGRVCVSKAWAAVPCAWSPN